MDEGKTADSLLEEDGVILAVGKKDELIIGNNSDCEAIDLCKKTILPAFLDAHSHLSAYANSFLQASLSDAHSFKEIIAALTEYCKTNNLQDGQWLIANGYDHNKLKEKSHPTKALLDEFFPKLNVVLQHISGHFGVMNSSAISTLKLDGKDDKGYIEENLWIDSVKSIPLPSPQQLQKAYSKAFYKYASYGITTVQDGLMVEQMIPMIKHLLSKSAFSLDVIGFPEISCADLYYRTFPKATDSYYKGFRLGGYKIILDGSPQGRTARMRTPYFGDKNEYGILAMTQKEVEKAFQKAICDKRQLLAHCNGDGACEVLLNAAKRLGNPDAIKSIKPVIIHAQLLAEDQLKDVKAFGMIPSFFIAHIYHWGDVHIENLGLSRASAISLAGSALNKSILFTFHQDTPVNCSNGKSRRR